MTPTVRYFKDKLVIGCSEDKSGYKLFYLIDDNKELWLYSNQSKEELYIPKGIQFHLVNMILHNIEKNGQ